MPTITQWKALNYKDRIYKVAPIHWDIDLSMVCNHRCPGCFFIGLPDDGYDSGLGVYRNMKTGGLLPTELVLKTLKSIKNVGGEAVTFVGGGEPTLHPDISNIMQATHNVGLKFGVISHFGRNYKDEFFESLRSATWVRVSTNAANPDTYAKMQGTNTFELGKVCENIKKFSDIGGNIGVSFLIHPDNVNEIFEGYKLFKKAGARYIQYKPFIHEKKLALYDGLLDTITKQLQQVELTQGILSDTFKVLNQFSTRTDQLDRFWKQEPCGTCWVANFNPKITADGKIYVCCELAYSNKGILGDLNSSTIEEMISSGTWDTIRRSINTDVCPPCWERDLNKSINNNTFNNIEPPEKGIDSEFV